MAEYQPLYKPGQATTRAASGTITGGQLVIVSGSGTVAAGTGATHLWLGVAGFDVVSGQNVTVLSGGVQRVIATGSITAGQPVEAATAGTVATHTLGTADQNIIGVALTTVTTGQLVEVAFTR